MVAHTASAPTKRPHGAMYGSVSPISTTTSTRRYRALRRCGRLESRLALEAGGLKRSICGLDFAPLMGEFAMEAGSRLRRVRFRFRARAAATARVLFVES